MSNANGAAAPAFQPVPQNVVDFKFSDKKATFSLVGVLPAFRSFISSESKRKQDEAARALLTREQRQAFDLGAITNYKDFFVENNIPNFPSRSDLIPEARAISDSRGDISEGMAKNIKAFAKKLKELNELRDVWVVFDECYESLKNHPKNKYADLLG